jgi:GNAT superfamily N-acetyltransferase
VTLATATTELEITPVTTQALHRDFCQLPYDLYRGDPRWVPPLRREENRRWSPEHNASLRRRWCQRFLARREGHVVGRIAAIVDEELCRRWLPESGLFGFLECVDDVDVLRGLIDAVEEALGRRGMRQMLGPVNLSTHDEVGLLVEGHDSAPMLLSPYNPPYYANLLSAVGLQPRYDYHAYRWTPASGHASAIDRLLQWQTQRDSAIVIRCSQPRRWPEETRTLFDLYNASFEKTWGFVPLSWDEFDDRARAFRRFYDPELVLFAEIEQKPVGFALVLPNVNEALAFVGGRLWPFGWLRLALAVPRIHSARFVLLGVLPEATGRGVAGLLAYEAARVSRRKGLREAELSLVHGDNRQIIRVIKAFGGVPCKTYRLFEKKIARCGGDT